MKKYIVVGQFLGVKAGQVLKLTEEQYQRRAQLVKKVGSKYEVLSDFHFKRGEVFETEQEISKMLADVVEEKEVYDKKPVEEKIEEMTKRELIDFAFENCGELELDPKMKRDDMVEAIINSQTDEE